MIKELIKKRTDGWINRKTGHGDKSFANAAMDSVRPVSVMKRVIADNLWRSDYLARIAITEEPSEALRKGYEIRSEEHEELHEICQTWADEFGLDAILLEAVNMARAHGGAWLVLVTDDVNSPAEMSRPFDPSKRYNLQNIVIASREEVTRTGQGINEPANRRFREAAFYNVNLRTYGGHCMYPNVHHSRLIYIPGRQTSYLTRLENDGYDDSVLQDLEEPLQNHWSASISMVELIYKASLLFFKTSSRGQAQALKGKGENEKSPLRERIEHIFEGLNVLGLPVLFEGEAIENITANFANLDKIKDKYSEEVSSGLRMPLTRLQGQAPGGFNTDGSSQQENWYSVVATGQTRVIGPVLKQVWTAILFAQDGPLEGAKPPKDWKVDWLPLDEPTEKMKAELRKELVGIVIELRTAQLISAEEARAMLAEDELLASHMEKVLVEQQPPEVVEPVVEEVVDASAA